MSLRTLSVVGPVALVALALAAPSMSATGPFTLRDGSSSGGYPMGGAGPSGETIRFIDRGSFWIAVLLRNTSKNPVTLLSVATPEPSRSLVRPASVGFAPFKPCSGHVACLWPAPRPAPQPSARPLTVAPGRYAAVKFGYRLVSCKEAALSTTASGTKMTVRFRSQSGTRGIQTFPLGYAKLHLLRPTGVECVPRPFSHIGLVGSFTTAPGHKPMPGSAGDTCTKTSTGGVAFISRTFFDRSGTAFTITITLPRFQGLGSYGHAARPLGPARVTARGGFGLHSLTSFTDNKGSVTVTTDAAGKLGGRFNATFSGHRRFFRGYGAWRCVERR